MQRSLVIGTRRSQLAMWQARWVAAELRRHWPDLEVTFEKIVTHGDRATQLPLHEVGGKGLFTKEIEQALLAGRIDLAVHSMKDLPTELPPGLTIGAVPAREDPRDVIVGAASCQALGVGARVGTSSLRRAAQLRALRPDLEIEAIRGKIDTRLRKLDEGRYDAILLAAAGLSRLGLSGRIGGYLPAETFLPAVGQGALGIEIRSGAEDVAELLHPIDDPPTSRSVASERAFLSALGGGCQTPIGAYARISGDDTILLSGLIASVDGTTLIRGEAEGNDPERLGRALAADLLHRGGSAVLKGLA